MYVLYQKYQIVIEGFQVQYISIHQYKLLKIHLPSSGLCQKNH